MTLRDATTALSKYNEADSQGFEEDGVFKEVMSR
jgi:hypothetical protein